jgi:putative hydrolase of HD superfamily
MEVKAPNPVESLPKGQIAPLVEAYFELCHLKGLYRQGWLRRDLPKARCESVAEHSFAMAILALWLAEAYFPELDSDKVLRMTLLHDFGEIYAGDIIPGDDIPPQEKGRREAASVEKVLVKLPNGKAYIDLWREFESGDSAEARFVRQIDRLEMGLQAAVYRREGFSNLAEFFQSARASLSEVPLLDLLAQAEGLSQKQNAS